MELLYMASHYPFRRDLLHNPYPDPQVIRVDMNPNDFVSKPLPPPSSAAQYTSSPSLDSQTDDDDGRLFDVDVEYTHIQSSQQELMYEHIASPSWASMATPRAWVGEAHKVPSLEPDSRRSSFAYPTADGGVTHHQDSSNSSTSSSIPLYNLSDYLENSSPVHSPPTSYLSPSGSVGTMLPQSYYSTSGPLSHAQQSPYALASRYNTSMQAHDPGCDPRFVSASAPLPHAGTSSSHHQDIGISFADVYSDPSQEVKIEQDQHSMDIGPANILHHHHLRAYESDSGEDEKSEDEDDPSYMPSSCLRPMSLPSPSRMRPRHMRSSSAGSNATIGLGSDSLHSQRPTRTPAPEPVPNLTKKSRGRRVPTAASLYGGSNGATANPSGIVHASSSKNARTYVCKVKECGKCFARSEHLKRHVRSIHTNEKPHHCPQPGCNKEFSRHDNLCQHMRVHRNFSAPKDGAFGSF